MEVETDLAQRRRPGLELLPTSTLSRWPSMSHRESSPNRSTTRIPTPSSSKIHNSTFPLILTTTAGQEGKQRRKNQTTEKGIWALIETSRCPASPLQLPPRKLCQEAEPPPSGTAPKHQDGTRIEGEDGLIFGDLTPQHHRLQQLLPPEKQSDDHLDEHAPDPADGIWPSTPSRHKGQAASKANSTANIYNPRIASSSTPASNAAGKEREASRGKRVEAEADSQNGG